MAGRRLAWLHLFALATLLAIVPGFVRADGVTIVTHGYNPSVSTTPAWLGATQTAIGDDWLGGEHKFGTITVTGSVGALTATCSSWDIDLTTATMGEIVVVLDWSAVADHLTTYIPAQDVAAAVVPKILQSQSGQRPLAELPIHLIGHSRGGGMVCEIARLLGEQGVYVDHLTPLDPHPLTASDPQPLPILHAAIVDTPAAIYANVLFADVYWQSVAYPMGESLTGAYNRLWTSLPGGYHNNSAPNNVYADHRNILLAYYGSIDLATPASNGEALMDTAERGWFNAYETSGTLAGANTGFYYSRIAARANRLSADQPVAGGDHVADGYHNAALLGGSGVRTALSWASATWPSLAAYDVLEDGTSQLLGSRTVRVGEVLGFRYTAADFATSCTVAVRIDSDRNPYNGNDLRSIAVVNHAASGSNLFQNTVWWNTSSMTPGTTCYPYAVIDNGTHVRYLYAAQPVVYSPPNQKPVAGAQGASLRFDGLRNYIDCGTSAALMPTTATTVEAWIRADAWRTAVTGGTVVGHDSTAGGYVLRAGAGGEASFCIRNSDNSAWEAAISPAVMQTGTWYHIAGVYDGTNVTIYIDGVQQASVDDGTAPGITGAATSLRIGDSPGFAGRKFNGCIDEVRVWNVARSAAQIRANMCLSLAGNEAGLVGYWRFDEGSGTTVHDATANANNGTLTGPTSWADPANGIAVLSADAATDLVLRLEGRDTDGTSLTARVTQVPAPAVGTFYQYDGAALDLRGAAIAGLPATVTDPERRVVFAPAAAASPQTGTLLWQVSDGLDLSDNAATSTLTVYPVLTGGVYVSDTTAPGPLRDGRSWGTAFATIQSAIDAAPAGSEVWVAQGTHTEALALKSQVAVYGGFQGFGGTRETLRTQRDWLANPAVIDGGIANGTGGAAVHVVTMDGVQYTLLDGFTVTGGAAGNQYGGGVFCNSADNTNEIAHCIVRNNSSSSSSGGGLGCVNASPTIRDCLIRNNAASGAYYGGGLVCFNSSAPQVVNCVFTANTAGAGGAVAGLSGGSPLLLHCTLSGNTAHDWGGAVACRSNTGTITLRNTIVEGSNSIALYEYDSTLNIVPVNCLFYNNSAGAFCDVQTTTYLDSQMAALNTGVTSASGNVTGDPLFANKASLDYHILAGSVAIDAGTATGASADDYDGFCRPVGAGYDIGAFEATTFGGAKIGFAPPALDFGSRHVGTGSSVPQTVEVWNTGGTTLTLTSVTPTGPGAALFAVVSDSGQAALASRARRTVAVEFNPTVVGPATAALTVASSDATSPTASVPLMGTGTNSVPVACVASASGAIGLDGVSDYVDCGTNAALMPTAAITVEAWIRADVWMTNIYEATVVGHDGSSSGYGLRAAAGGKAAFYIRNADNTAWKEAISPAVMATGEWHHLAGVYDGDTVRIYIDGTERATVDDGSSPGIAPSDAPLWIGESPGYPGRKFMGQIDDVRVWNVARTPAQIQSDMNLVARGDEPGLAGYWRFDEGSGATAHDATANGNDGTLLGAPDWIAPATTPLATDVPTTATASGHNLVLTLDGRDGDGDSLVARVQSLPAGGTATLRQYDAATSGGLGAVIASVPALVTDPQRRVVLIPGVHETTATAVLTWDVTDGLVYSDTPATYTITIRASGYHRLTYLAAAHGSISGAWQQDVADGADGSSVQAVPNTNYRFTDWSDGSIENPRTDTHVTASLTVTAHFGLGQYVLTYLAGPGGSITGTAHQAVNSGASGTQVTAVAAPGFRFVRWSDGVLTASRTDTNIVADLTVTATFERIPPPAFWRLD